MKLCSRGVWGIRCISDICCLGVRLELSRAAPKHIEFPYPTSAEEPKDLVTVSWILNPCTETGFCEIFDAERRVELGVLSYLLTGTKASPLYEKLADSGIGSAVLNIGLDFDTKQALYTIGLKGQLRFECIILIPIRAFVSSNPHSRIFHRRDLQKMGTSIWISCLLSADGSFTKWHFEVPLD